MEKLIQEVIKDYKDNLSLLKISEKHQISRSKARKILISEGLINSTLIIDIRKLLEKGNSKKEICNILNISSSTFSDNVAYKKGLYHQKERSKQALRSERFRIRELLAIKRKNRLIEEGRKNEQMLQNNSKTN